MEGMEAVAHNPPALKQQRDRAQKAFSLIEAAFVLAVVGVVIGTIWVSAANMYESYKVNKTAEEVLMTARNIQNLISIRDAEAIGYLTVLTSELQKAGVFPKSWESESIVKNPFGGSVLVQNFVPSDPRFDFRINGIPRSACIKLVVKISSIGLMAGASGSGRKEHSSLDYIQTNYPYWSTTTFPVSLDTARTACNLSSNQVIFTFGYTRIN